MPDLRPELWRGIPWRNSEAAIYLKKTVQYKNQRRDFLIWAAGKFIKENLRVELHPTDGICIRDQVHDDFQINISYSVWGEVKETKGSVQMVHGKCFDMFKDETIQSYWAALIEGDSKTHPISLMFPEHIPLSSPTLALYLERVRTLQQRHQLQPETNNPKSITVDPSLVSALNLRFANPFQLRGGCKDVTDLDQVWRSDVFKKDSDALDKNLLLRFQTLFLPYKYLPEVLHHDVLPIILEYAFEESRDTVGDGDSEPVVVAKVAEMVSAATKAAMTVQECGEVVTRLRERFGMDFLRFLCLYFHPDSHLCLLTLSYDATSGEAEIHCGYHLSTHLRLNLDEFVDPVESKNKV